MGEGDIRCENGDRNSKSGEEEVETPVMGDSEEVKKTSSSSSSSAKRGPEFLWSSVSGDKLLKEMMDRWRSRR